MFNWHFLPFIIEIILTSKHAGCQSPGSCSGASRSGVCHVMFHEERAFVEDGGDVVLAAACDACRDGRGT